MKNMFAESKERFSIRKYTIGVASVLLSTLVFVEGNVYADEVRSNTNEVVNQLALVLHQLSQLLQLHKLVPKLLHM